MQVSAIRAAPLHMLKWSECVHRTKIGIGCLAVMAMIVPVLSLTTAPAMAAESPVMPGITAAQVQRFEEAIAANAVGGDDVAARELKVWDTLAAHEQETVVALALTPDAADGVLTEDTIKAAGIDASAVTTETEQGIEEVEVLESRAQATPWRKTRPPPMRTISRLKATTA